MNDYERIAKIIRYLDEHRFEQPDLAQLAGHAGLSPFHLHRLFSKWAGITPKDFLQCLTLTHVKQLLQGGENILETALASGLSGPGRVHDLCVSLEAASPGELKSAGAGWTLNAGFSESPFGTCLIAESPRGICHLAFVDAGEEHDAWKKLQAEWRNATRHRDDVLAARISHAIFSTTPPHQSRPPLRALVRGTPFQLRVWRALLQIPTGRLVSYGTLAEAIARPSAARAVGSAVAANPVAFLIPCHRVIRETGVIGDYRWGQTRKRALVAWESGRALAASPLALA